jgi:5-formyltetrahydrofolate cyclo-ligase
MMLSKTQTRDRFRGLPRLSPEARTQKSAALCAALLRDALWQRARSVALFAPLSMEPDVELLFAFAEGKRLCFPKVLQEGLAFFGVSSPDLLVCPPGSRWRVREPREGACMRVEELDLILVPGVAFTPGGRRLGRGAGYYDRFLAAGTAHRIGTCFESQLVPDLPVEPHDMPMHRVLTESGFCPGSGPEEPACMR